MAHLPDYSNIASWARFALTGDADAKTPSDGALQFVTPSVLADFLIANPCTADGDGGYSTLSPADTAALEEAVGALVAERFLGTRAGLKFAGDEKQIKLGPVTTTKKAASVESMKADCVAAAAKARLRISCIREALTATGTVKLFGLAGRSRVQNCRNGERY